MLSVRNPLRLLTTVAKEAEHPHPNQKLSHTQLQQACCNSAVLPASFLYSMSSEPSPPNSPGQLPLTDAPNPINHFPLNWKCQKTERGVPELTLWEDVWAEPEAYPQHTCRCGIHREDSRGHKQGRNTICRQEDLVLVPRVHKGNSNDLAFHTPAPPLLPASSTESSVRGSTLCHGGDTGESQHINIDIR